ncbi:hypothetical protein M885DRAFT_520562 [Pelagophyceae sp. CCMP2097]|nr:hypothetical protein M885DRAFT_520562 [Pelagophyceae sp. CCMP2097]
MVAIVVLVLLAVDSAHGLAGGPLAGLLGGLRIPARGGRSKETELLSAELFEACAAYWTDREPLDEQRLSTVVDSLASKRVDFDPVMLEGGLWLSLYTRGPKPKWQRNAELLGFALKNKAGQSYDAEKKTVQNYGELLGGFIAFSADGTFQLPAEMGRCPVDIGVSVESGGISISGLAINLGIKGPGLLRVEYVDDRVRIFTSPKTSPDEWEAAGLTVVQIREAALDAWPAKNARP